MYAKPTKNIYDTRDTQLAYAYMKKLPGNIVIGDTTQNAVDERHGAKRIQMHRSYMCLLGQLVSRLVITFNR